MLKRIILALVLLPYLVPLHAQVTVPNIIDYIQTGTTGYECYRVEPDGTKTHLSNHSQERKALSACANRKILDPEGEYRVRNTGYIKIVLDSDAAAQYLRLPTPVTTPEENPSSFTRYTIDGGVLTFDSGSNTVSESNGTFTLSIAGGEIWQQDDYIDAPGWTLPSGSDFVLIARVNSYSCDDAACLYGKAGWMIRADNAEPGSQMYFPNRIGSSGHRHTIRTTLDGTAENNTPNPYSSSTAVPQWQMVRVDCDVPAARVYWYFSGSDPGSDPDVNWVFDRELTDSEIGAWFCAADMTALYAVTPNDSADAGWTALASVDIQPITFPSLDFSPSTPPAIALSSNQYSDDEDAGTITITATRAGAGSGACDVDYSTSDGTAVAGTDYTAASGTLHWNDSETGDKTFDIPITNRAGVAQGNTSLTTALAINSCPDTLTSPSSATVSIVDLDIVEDSNAFPTQTPSYDAILPGIVGFGANWGDLSAETWNYCEVATPTRAALQACIDTTWTGCRLVYFSTSGIIDIGTDTQSLDVGDNCLYVAGQTAPSPGIWFSGNYLRINPGAGGYDRIAFVDIGQFGKLMSSNQPNGGDDITINSSISTHNSRILFVNYSAMWGTDETVGMGNNSDNVSFYQSIVGPGLINAGHPDSSQHAMGMIIGNSATVADDSVDIQRSVIAHNNGRFPLTSADNFGLYNSILYDGQYEFTTLRASSSVDQNIENNLYMTGPATGGTALIKSQSLSGSANTYVSGNCAVGRSDSTQSQMVSGFTINGSRLAGAFPTGAVLQGIGTCGAQEEIDFANLVMDCAGPRPSERAGGGGSEITDHLATITARLNNTAGQGGLVDGTTITVPTVATNTVDHSATAYPRPTNPNDTTGGVYINAALDWAAYWHEQVTPSKCGQVRP